MRDSSEADLPSPDSSRVRVQLTVSISTLLFPPLVHPRSPEFPLGVCTMTFTCPGSGITAVESFTFNSEALTTVAPIGVALITTCVEETKLLPLTLSVVPCCTSAKLIVAGVIEPITGTGRALPQSGFKVLLQPDNIAVPSTSREAKSTPQRQRRIGRHSFWMGSPSLCRKPDIRIWGRTRLLGTLQSKYHLNARPAQFQTHL